MSDPSLRILQVSTSDIGGGAERIAWQLFQAYRKRGCQSWLAVGTKLGNDPDVLVIPNDAHRNPLTRSLLHIVDLVVPCFEHPRLHSMLRRRAELLSEPRRLVGYWQGREDFEFPGTPFILDLPPQRPDIVHCHNLHWNYFDLRILPRLSAQVPTLLTLHDGWLLSGHCAHSFDCERWKTGCGNCPDLTIFPPIKRDATAHNWQTKRNIFAKSQFYVATPSRWLMDKVRESVLSSAIIESAVIPNGMDLSIFRPACDKQEARAKLGIPPDVALLLFVASGIRSNIWKDYRTLREAVEQVADRQAGRNVLCLALGEDAPAERVGAAWVNFVPYKQSPEEVVRYYQAADLYIHAARVDTFPNTIIEAMACGIPVIATAVGGIFEQVRSLSSSSAKPRFPIYGPERSTGVLVPPGDAPAMATAICKLLEDEPLRCQLAVNARLDAERRFDLERQVAVYLEWYQAIIDRSSSRVV